jgi:serine/threonine protein kinase/tetratricopeptide (TPR) repeat protein
MSNPTADYNVDEAGIFDAARLIADPQRRKQFLQETCGQDTPLQSRIESLLRIHDEQPGFLETTPIPRFATNALAGTEQPAMQIGPYKLIRQIGEGGFGAVFLAEQEKPLCRTVALKILKPGMDTRQIVSRFEAEREALALMDHPNIAKVLDAGAVDDGRLTVDSEKDEFSPSTVHYPPSTAGGQPYFVMELVKGDTITSYCKEHRLAVRERLALFVPLCHALQHAHQKGIIHRDIKPSNILVTTYDGKPMPKVIDFGIAKALGGQLPEHTLMTGAGGLIGTLEYMSPEQAEFNARDIDTRADIYSLGVLLYELLTGTTPLTRQRIKQTPVSEVLRLIREEEPPRPSTRLAETQAGKRGREPLFPAAPLPSEIRGELDWIVMKCLEKERRRRYETAGSLARDIDHYLHDEPVMACPPSACYRLGKFARRHKAALTTLVAVAFAMLAGLAVSVWYAVEADKARKGAEAAEKNEALQRQRAEAALQQAMEALRATTDDVVEKLLGAKLVLGPNEKEFVDSTLKRWQTFAAQQGEGEPARKVRAEGLFRVAVLRHKLGQNEEARAGYHEAIAETAQLAADFPGVPQYRQDLGRSQNNLGILFRELGQPAEAEMAYRQALAIRDKLVADFPAAPQYWQDLARSHINQGLLLASRGKLKDAEAAYRQALGIQDKLVADFPAVPRYWQELARSHNNMGNLLSDLGKRADAEAAYRQSLVIRDKLAAEFSSVPQYREELAVSLNNLGLSLDSLGKRADSESAYRRAQEIQEKLAAEFPAVPQYRQDLADSHNDFGNLLRDSGKRAEAETAFREALAIQNKLAADFPAVPKYQQNLATSHNNLGNLLRDLGKPAEAEAAYRQALEVRQKLAASFPDLPQHRQELAGSHNTLGIVFSELGKRAEAEVAFSQALAIREKLVADFPTVPRYRQHLIESHNNVGLLLSDLGKHAEAEAAFQKAVAIGDKLAGDFPNVPTYRRYLATSQNNLGNLLSEQGKRVEAESAYRQALAIREKLAVDFPAVPQHRQELAASHNKLGNLLRELGKRADADAAIRQALVIQDKLTADFPTMPQYRQELAGSHNNLGLLLIDLGKRAEAEAAYRQALDIREKLAASFPAVPTYRTELGESQVNVGQLHCENQPAQAQGWYDQAIANLEDVLSEVKVDATAKQILRNAYWGRARALDLLKSHAEAARDWDKAVELTPPAQRAGIRMGRALSRVRTGRQVGEAIQEAEELAKNASANTLYDAA